MEKISEEFEIAFHGPAVEDNSISARDLGASMIALGDLLEYANKSLYGEGNKSVLRIKATRGGSFEAAFEHAIKSVSDTATFLEKSPVDVIKLLIGVPSATASLFAIYRYLKGRRPKENEVEESNGEIHITSVGNPNTIIVNNNTYKMYINQDVRSAMRSFVSPLDGDGIERMDINREGERVERIDENEVEFYDVSLEEEEEKIENIQEIYVLIISLSFKPGDKWRVSTGEDETSFFVSIKDDDFTNRVSQRMEEFKAGDSLRVKLQTLQWTEDGKLKTEKNIVNVLGHIHADEQGKLEF